MNKFFEIDDILDYDSMEQKFIIKWSPSYIHLNIQQDVECIETWWDDINDISHIGCNVYKVKWNPTKITIFDFKNREYGINWLNNRKVYHNF